VESAKKLQSTCWLEDTYDDEVGRPEREKPCTTSAIPRDVDAIPFRFKPAFEEPWSLLFIVHDENSRCS
jgi:hypothetical protein